MLSLLLLVVAINHSHAFRMGDLVVVPSNGHPLLPSEISGFHATEMHMKTNYLVPSLHTIVVPSTAPTRHRGDVIDIPSNGLPDAGISFKFEIKVSSPTTNSPSTTPKQDRSFRKLLDISLSTSISSNVYDEPNAAVVSIEGPSSDVTQPLPNPTPEERLRGKRHHSTY